MYKYIHDSDRAIYIYIYKCGQNYVEIPFILHTYVFFVLIHLVYLIKNLLSIQDAQ